jgi:hypothetical protein
MACALRSAYASASDRDQALAADYQGAHRETVRAGRCGAPRCIVRAPRADLGFVIARVALPCRHMATQCSFDVTSNVDLQEVDNALNQARKEVAQRYDFKGAKASIDFDANESKLVLIAEDEFKLNALWEIVSTRLVRRNVPVKNLTRGAAQSAANSTVRQEIALQQGIPSEKAKDIVKFVKDSKLKKVQASIQGDQLRVSSGSKDDLQEVMRLLREQDFGVALQFGNYRG